MKRRQKARVLGGPSQRERTERDELLVAAQPVGILGIRPSNEPLGMDVDLESFAAQEEPDHRTQDPDRQPEGDNPEPDDQSVRQHGLILTEICRSQTVTLRALAHRYGE